MKQIEIRPNGSKRVYTINNEPSKTDGSQLKDTDVNVIMNRVLRTRDESILRQRQGQYADLTQIPDLGTALNQVKEAQDAFDSLPALTRRRFNNSAVELVEFLQDPNNNEEAYQLGLRTRPRVIPPDPISQPTSPEQPQP